VVWSFRESNEKETEEQMSRVESSNEHALHSHLEIKISAPTKAHVDLPSSSRLTGQSSGPLLAAVGVVLLPRLSMSIDLKEAHEGRTQSSASELFALVCSVIVLDS
jgi:hypothetical protein